MTKKTPVIGDQVTCIYASSAYYSNYGPNKGRHIIFRPGMIGTVASITPKVSKFKGSCPDGYDMMDDFLVVDFIDETGEKQRTGLDYANARKTNPKGEPFTLVIRQPFVFAENVESAYLCRNDKTLNITEDDLKALNETLVRLKSKDCLRRGFEIVLFNGNVVVDTLCGITSNILRN